MHLSDLHFGAGARLEARTAALVEDLVARDVDHVVVTGDVTEHGRHAEFERFCRVFEPLALSGRKSAIGIDQMQVAAGDATNRWHDGANGIQQLGESEFGMGGSARQLQYHVRFFGRRRPPATCTGVSGTVSHCLPAA